MAYLQDVLEAIGLERERIRMIFISAAEGERFRQFAVEMDNTIRKLGPSKLHQHQIVATAEAKAKAEAKARKKASKSK